MTLEENITWLESLEDNWDDEGSSKISPKCIKRAKNIALMYGRDATLNPGCSGGVNLCWHNIEVWAGYFTCLIVVSEDDLSFYADLKKSKKYSEPSDIIDSIERGWGWSDEIDEITSLTALWVFFDKYWPVL